MKDYRDQCSSKIKVFNVKEMFWLAANRKYYAAYVIPPWVGFR